MYEKMIKIFLIKFKNLSKQSIQKDNKHLETPIKILNISIIVKFFYILFLKI